MHIKIVLYAFYSTVSTQHIRCSSLHSPSELFDKSIKRVLE